MSGTITVSSDFYASKQIGVEYDGSSWYNLASSSWSQPTFDTSFDFNSGEIEREPGIRPIFRTAGVLISHDSDPPPSPPPVSFVLKPTAEFYIWGGLSNIAEIGATASTSLTPEVQLELEASRRRLSAGEGDVQAGLLLEGSPLALGSSVLANVTSARDVRDAVFRLSADCWDGAFLTLQHVDAIPAGLPTTVQLPLPWHSLLTGNKCEEYTIAVRSGFDARFALESVPFAFQAPDECASTVVSAPTDGEFVASDRPYKLEWVSAWKGGLGTTRAWGERGEFVRVWRHWARVRVV